MNRSTFWWNTFSLCALVSPTPQKSEGRRCASTARQKADTIFAGVEWSSIEGFLAGTLVAFVTVERVETMLVEICVLSFDASEISSGCGGLYFVAWSRTWKNQRRYFWESNQALRGNSAQVTFCTGSEHAGSAAFALNTLLSLVTFSEFLVSPTMGISHWSHPLEAYNLWTAERSDVDLHLLWRHCVAQIVAERCTS